MIKIEIVVFMLVICAAGRAQDSSPVILSSPNNHNLLTMTLTLEADGALTYDLRASGKTVLDRSALSLEINGKGRRAAIQPGGRCTANAAPSAIITIKLKWISSTTPPFL